MPPKHAITNPHGNMNGICPHCGKPLQSVEYYSARPIEQHVVGQFGSTQKVQITYTDVNPHIGSICLNCAYENGKSKRSLGKVMLILGGAGSFIAMIAGIVLARMAENEGGNVGAAMTPAMLLMGLLFLVAITGLALAFEGRAFRAASSFSKEQLFSIFINALYKEHRQGGVVYLSPEEAAQLKRA